uniref:Membrane protein n=1 Tax=Marseillevirus LCMAC101 TaxID=2506602 RepID=A0A481YR58_9VIRU|nr:MAG: membrane protein [Marseillevirus LCMAC101]
MITHIFFDNVKFFFDNVKFSLTMSKKMELDPSTIWIIILIMFILATIGFAIWVQMLNPVTKKCNQLKKESPAWNENCLYPQAIGKPDSSIADPSDKQLYMAGFSYSAAGGLPLCLPLWYRFRYVNDKSGNYSPFSKWTCSAVMAGGTNLPCDPNCPDSCDKRISGDASCSFNRVAMGVTEALQDGISSPEKDGSINWAVVYRYVGKENNVDTPPSEDPNVGDPLGFLVPSSSYSGYTNVFTDVGNNPCPVVKASVGCPQKCSICR